MSKKISLKVQANGPSFERVQHTPFVRESVTEANAPVICRHRTRNILTPYAVRRAIFEEIAEKPEVVRLRSIRRRLTALDRALSDREAEMLERLTNCINELSNIGCVNYLKSEVRSTGHGRLPFSDRKRKEIEAMSAVLKSLTAIERLLVFDIARQLDPSASQPNVGKNVTYLLDICTLAARIAALYGTVHQGPSHKKRLRHEESQPD